jgi:hypothetical protein
MHGEGRALKEGRQAAKAQEKARKRAGCNQESLCSDLRQFLTAEFAEMRRQPADLPESAERIAALSESGTEGRASADAA